MKGPSPVLRTPSPQGARGYYPSAAKPYTLLPIMKRKTAKK